MSKDLSCLKNKDYPGRVIIIGRDLTGKNVIVVYAITGRSPSSQARWIETTDDGAWVKPTDEKILKEGNKELLIYPAILFGQGIAVSNGRQTSSIRDKLSSELNPEDILRSALLHWEYESDAPIFTPRISGCVLPDGRAALSIIKRREDGSSSKDYFKVPMLTGKGKMISTYSGKNIEPLPSFKGEPGEIPLICGTPKETAEAIYAAMGPSNPERDFRVAVACVFFSEEKNSKSNISVINRSEKK